MKKIMLVLGLVASLFAGGNMSKKIIEDVLSNNKILAPYTNYINSGYDNGTYYIFKLPVRGNPTAYVSKTGETFIGYGFDKSGNELKMPIDGNIVKNGIAFSFGKGKDDLYVVTDPECPYCAKFETMAKGKLENKFRVHVILMPLSFHKNAKAMSYYVLNGKNDEERLTRFSETVTKKNTNYKNFVPTKDELAKYSTYLVKSKKAAAELGATGTPMVYDKNFKKVNWPKLVK